MAGEVGEDIGLVEVYTIGGTVTGLAGVGLVLQNNGGDDFPVDTDGEFVFAMPLSEAVEYAVTVLTQPTSPNQTCTVSNGTGSVGTTPVTDIEVICSDGGYTIGLTVIDLAGTGLVLQNNGGDDLPIDLDGSFVFSMPLADGAEYAVTVLTLPVEPGQICTVNNGTGTIGGADVSDIEVLCSDGGYTILVTVTGLVGTGLVLQNNGGDDLSVEADGTFAFATRLADGGGYAVAVVTQPTNPSQTCDVANGLGTVIGADITDITVECLNDPINGAPSISGDPLTLVGENQFYEFTPLADDPDGDVLTFAIVNQPAWADFDTATGSLTGTPPTVDVGTHPDIIISAEDPGGLTASLPAFSILVVETLTAFIDDPAANGIAPVGIPLKFTASAAGGLEPLIFHWDFGDGVTTSDQEDPGLVAISSIGTFAVSLSVTDSLGTVVVDGRTVTVFGSTVAQVPVFAVVPAPRPLASILPVFALPPQPRATPDILPVFASPPQPRAAPVNLEVCITGSCL